MLPSEFVYIFSIFSPENMEQATDCAKSLFGEPAGLVPDGNRQFWNQSTLNECSCGHFAERTESVHDLHERSRGALCFQLPVHVICRVQRTCHPSYQNLSEKMRLIEQTCDFVRSTKFSESQRNDHYFWISILYQIRYANGPKFFDPARPGPAWQL